MKSPRRLMSVMGPAVLGLALLAGCASEPSAKRVALDIVDGVEGLTDAQRDCMRTRVNAYDNSTLTELGKANKDVDFVNGGEGNEAIQEFQADLAECMTDAGVAATDSSGPDESEPTGTEPAGTEPVGSDPADTLG